MMLLLLVLRVLAADRTLLDVDLAPVVLGRHLGDLLGCLALALAALDGIW